MLKTAADDIIGTTPDRMYTYPQLGKDWGIPYTRQHLARLEAAGRFPRRIRCGARIGWLGSELAAWQRNLVAKRDQDIAAA